MKILVVGMGSPHGDDQAGWQLVDELQKYSGKNNDWRLYKSQGGGMDWFSHAKDAECLFLVDAVISNQPPGTLYHWSQDMVDRILQASPSCLCADTHAAIVSLGGERLHSSSHAMPLLDSLHLARELGILPRNYQLLGIEADSMQPLAALSEPVRQACRVLAKQLLNFLSHGGEFHIA